MLIIKKKNISKTYLKPNKRLSITYYRIWRILVELLDFYPLCQ